MLRGRVTVVRPPDSEENDASHAEFQRWMERIQGGDEEALGQLFRATYTRLCRHARTYVHSASVAEDIVDDTFLKLWANREQIQVHGSVRNYLHTAVRNCAINYLRRQRLEAKYFEPPTAVDPELALGKVENEVEGRLHTEELMTRLQEAIDALPPRTRQAYTLHTQHNMRYSEIAHVMGISVRTVEHQVAKAVRTLWNRLERFV